MKTYQFPYTIQSILGADELSRFRYLPLLKIALMNDARLIKIQFAYIDTGCQWCLFDKSFAQFIGIEDYKISKYKPVEMCGIAGIGEHKEHINVAYFHKAKLIVYKNPKKPELKDAWKIETEIGFTEKSFGFPAILGVRGLLNQFAFKTNIPEGFFELTPLFDISD